MLDLLKGSLLMTIHGTEQIDDPREINPTPTYIVPFWIMATTFTVWLIMVIAGFSLPIAHLIMLGHDLLISVRGLLMFLWIMSLYNIVHNIIFMVYIASHDINETPQPLHYLVGLKWYNAL